MFTYRANINPEKLGDFLLVEPKGLGFVEHLDPDSPLLGLVQNELPFVVFFGVFHALVRSSATKRFATGSPRTPRSASRIPGGRPNDKRLAPAAWWVRLGEDAQLSPWVSEAGPCVSSTAIGSSRGSSRWIRPVATR